MKKVILRADGNAKIGLGHVYRCLAIAERLKNHFSFHFAIQNPSQDLKRLIAEHSQVIELKETSDYGQEVKKFLNILRSENMDIVVLDGYNFDTDYQLSIKKARYKVICIDDDQPFCYASDVVINHADEMLQSKILTEPYTRVYTGLKYSLLRAEFVALESCSRHIDKIESVFVCFGGADPGNNTIKAVQAAVDVGMKKVVVLTGAAYDFREDLKRMYQDKDIVQLYSNLDANGIIKLMRSCELAIVPASTIALEAFTAKMFLLTGTTASNQRYILDGLTKHQSVFNVGDFNAVSKLELKKLIKAVVTNSRHTFECSNEPSTSNLLDVFNSLL